MILVRPCRSARMPARRAAVAPVRRMEETMMPWTEGVISPKVEVKEGIVVTGPMMPVSSLWDFVSISESMDWGAATVPE